MNAASAVSQTYLHVSGCLHRAAAARFSNKLDKMEKGKKKKYCHTNDEFSLIAE